jgi:uncharacterized membrane protein
MTSKCRTLLLLFALLGLGASSVSTFVHYKLLTTPNYESFCDVGSAMNCTQAYLSQYGSFMGVPVAIGGVIFFAVVALLAGMAGGPSSSARDNAAGYIFLISTIGLAFALVVLPIGGVLHPVRDHVRVGRGDLHHLRRSDQVPHDDAAGQGFS